MEADSSRISRIGYFGQGLRPLGSFWQKKLGDFYGDFYIAGLCP